MRTDFNHDTARHDTLGRARYSRINTPGANMKSKARSSRLIAALFLCAYLASGLLIQGSATTSALPAASGADWPQWRGPQRSGISNETGLFKEWPKEGPKLIWQIKDIGEGYSTPAVVGTRIYLLSNK